MHSQFFLINMFHQKYTIPNEKNFSQKKKLQKQKKDIYAGLVDLKKENV